MIRKKAGGENDMYPPYWLPSKEGTYQKSPVFLINPVCF